MLSRFTAYPGPPSAPKIVSAFKDCINLTWTPPTNTGGTGIMGYNMEKRKKGSNLWGQVNPQGELIQGLYNTGFRSGVTCMLSRVLNNYNQDKFVEYTKKWHGSDA